MSSSGSSSVLIKTDFDSAMGASNKPFHKFLFRHPDSKEIYLFFKKLFNENFDSPISDKPLIPEIIHQVWLSKEHKTYPRFFDQYVASVKKAHPKWKYKLWTLDNITQLKRLNPEILNKLLTLDSSNPSFSATFAADYIKLLAVEQYGGVYMDLDYVVFKPLNELNRRYRMYGMLGAPSFYNKMPVSMFSMIASEPHHKVIDATILSFEKYVMDHDFRTDFNKQYTTWNGQVFSFSESFLWGGSSYNLCKKDIRVCDRQIFFPVGYFAPYPRYYELDGNGAYYSLLDRLIIAFKPSYSKPFSQAIPDYAIAANDWNAKTSINPIYRLEMLRDHKE